MGNMNKIGNSVNLVQNVIIYVILKKNLLKKLQNNYKIVEKL